AAVLVAIIERNDFGAFAYVHDLGEHAGVRRGGADLIAVAVADQQHIQFHLVADLIRQFFDGDAVTFFHAILFIPTAHNGVHDSSTQTRQDFAFRPVRSSS